MTRNLFSEYEFLQRRIDKISDPMYLMELRRKNLELENRLKTLSKE
jgi:hypothetical protein